LGSAAAEESGEESEEEGGADAARLTSAADMSISNLCEFL
jgi:hypothetical protein